MMNLPFISLNVDWVFVRNQILRCINENATAQLELSRSSCYILTFLCLSLLHLEQVKQIVKVQ